MSLQLFIDPRIGFVLLFALLSACSNKGPNTFVGQEGPINFSEAFCKGPTVVLPNDQDIQGLHQNVLRLRDLLNAHDMGGLLYRGNYYANGSDLSPANPLYVSTRINHQMLQEINQSLSHPQNQRFHEWLVKGNLPDTIKEEDLDFAAENYLGLIVSQIEGLFEMQQRLRVNQCQKESLKSRRSEDIRAFATLMAGECPRGMLYTSSASGAMVSACLQYILDEWDTLEARFLPLAEMVKSNLMSVCQHLLKPNCGETIEQELNNGNGYQYWANLKAQYRSGRYDTFFAIVETKKDFVCRNTRRETLILMDIYFGSEITANMRELLKRDLIEYVAPRWSRAGKLKFVFNFPESEKQGQSRLQIHWSTVPISYVPDQQRNLMYLDPAMARNDKTSARRMVMAHEFGHVLGYRDCYVEFYESESDQFVFYQVDSRNIMCSISAATAVPDNHHLQIINKRCSF